MPAAKSKVNEILEPMILLFKESYMY